MPAGWRRPSNILERACEYRARILRIPSGLGKCQADYSSLQQVKQRKDENPDEIDKVPEKSADFDTIGQVLGIALVKPLAHRQPHVNEHQHATKHVKTMYAGDRKIAGK